MMDDSYWGTDQAERLIPSGKVQSVREEDGKAYISFEKGEARVASYGQGILRLTLAPGLMLNLKSIAVMHDSDNQVSVLKEGRQYQISGDGVSLSIVDEKPGLMIKNAVQNDLLELGQVFYITRDRVILTATISENCKIFGLGEKTGFLDKVGRCYTMWNTDDPLHTPDKDPLYKSIPFMIFMDDRKTFGMFLDSTAKIDFDLGFKRRIK